MMDDILHWRTLVELGVVCFVCIVGVKWIWSKALGNEAKLPYPPGPTAKSWVAGNLSDMPLEGQWFLFTEWAKVYGDLTYLRVLQNHIVVINNLEVATELLEKRSNNYSSRPNFPMADLMGWDFSSTFKLYGDTWRSHRRMFQQYFRPEVVRNYEGIQIQKNYDMLFQLLNDPENFMSHIRHSSGAIILSALYGLDVAVKNDPYVSIAKKAMDNLTQAMFPGTFLVNTIPFLRFVPEWFPGTSFKRFARETKVYTDQMLNGPIEKVQQLMGMEGVRPCIAADMLENLRSEKELEDIKCVCATSYAGGADTSVSSVSTFFYAMVNFYDVQKKAQDEIDRVIGSERLPDFQDRSSLPYCEALLRETLRWRPILPLGVAHTASKEDIFQGYYIPKGTTLMPNIWGMTRDTSRYDDPEAFNPSRFFDKNGSLNNDNVDYVFGFGRRICPGRHLASATVWLSIVTVLATFDIRKKKDGLGKDIPVDGGYTKAILIHPLPFECSLSPRSKTAEALIRDAVPQLD
ncbi:cytochrome P450 [Crepidotus variabilis]|uniref:Cytochrome P450 n=1 Tax=Crepidotus variabilis TaxID=179855 RepID=A0A9P6JJ72_9AGAR|nr:cytochrome P450 [Crepidotus variabilis]